MAAGDSATVHTSPQADRPHDQSLSLGSLSPRSLTGASFCRPSPGDRLRALLLLGPTASGKSAVALALAERFPIEIVTVDSAQVYRGMDIGTAKPDAADQARVPHHLIDVCDPLDPYSAARFAADATVLIDAIRARGRLPVLAGGTMLYAHALLYPMDDMPAADPAVRARIEDEAARLGWPALHAQLATLDPVTAARLHPTDRQRIQRALEVHALTGQALSTLHAAATPRQAVPGMPVLSLEPADRSVLHARIATRFAGMLRAGLLEEVRALHARPGMHAALPAMRAVGYRQAWSVLEGSLPAERLEEAGIVATRQLARRQLTWLRGWPVHQRLDALAPDLTDQVCRIVDTLIGPD